jgi:hypothetical protein
MFYCTILTILSVRHLISSFPHTSPLWTGGGAAGGVYNIYMLQNIYNIYHDLIGLFSKTIL